ncbi:MAG: hypothetical protein R3A79_31245 [Nannocystaceae bacterium]
MTCLFDPIPLLARNTGHPIDRIYDSFVAELPAGIQDAARGLPQRLGLTQGAEVPWSQVFDNTVLLCLPTRVAGGVRHSVPRELVKAAQAAHLFGVIGALGVDGIRGGAIDQDTESLATLYQVHRARDRAFSSLGVDHRADVLDYRSAELLAREAVGEEARCLSGEEAATRARYRLVALKKQAMIFPATVAAAVAAGWSAGDVARLEGMIGGLTLGQQYRSDVVRWIDDHARGGAWAVTILAGEYGVGIRRSTLSDLAGQLHTAGILTDLLQLSSRGFAKAAVAARELGIPAIERWAREQARLTSGLALFESVEPGYTVQWEVDRRSQRRREQLEGCRDLAAAS